MPSKIHWTIQQFLDGYPDEGDDPSLSANLLFYSDRLRCQPDELKITEIHQQYLLIFRLPISNVDHYHLGGLDATERWRADTGSFSGCMFCLFS
jgi:hypothetical protein